MLEIRRILCPIDFSDSSAHALGHAGVLARWSDATVKVLYVHPTVVATAFAPGMPLLPSMLLTPADRAAVLRNVKDFAASRLGPGVNAEYALREGEAPAEILDVVHEDAVDLVVIATRGRAGLERLVMGSVAEKVLRQAACPVLTVPPRVVVDGAAPSSATFRRILCAVDFSPCSMDALRYAVSVAAEAGGQLTVLHVIEFLPEETERQPGVADHAYTEFTASVRQERQARLEACIPPGARDRCTVDLALGWGRPYREILRQAGDLESDLIVIGVHGRSPLGLFFLGSTAQQLTRHAGCPVLTVRSERGRQASRAPSES